MVSGAATLRYPPCLRREPGGGAGGDTDEVAEFRGNADEPDRPDRAGRDTPEPVGDSRPARARVEPRSRAEYAADLEQRAVSGWEASGSRDADVREPPSEQVRWFEPERAGLADISPQEAAAYIDGRRDGRPWLTVAAGCPPEVQRLFAALDQGGGHGHIRHEGWITEEMNRRRVAYLEDPTEPDPARRAAGLDGLRPGDQPHRCRQMATRITDASAFAGRDDDQRMRVFKEELRQALADPGRLPESELDNAVEFTDENEAAFLRRLWRDLYGDEPT